MTPSASIGATATGEAAPNGGMPAWLAWVLGGVFGIVMMIVDYLAYDDGVIADCVVWGRDFVNVWTGGKLVSAGQLATIYDFEAYGRFQRGLFGALVPHNYSYPPVTFPLAALFAALPYPVALGAWLVGTGALFAYAARPWWPVGAGPHWLALATPAALLNIWSGHYGFLIGALVLLGWQRLERGQPMRAGMVFGLLLIKPHLAVLIPLALLLRGEWRALWAGAVTVAILVAGSVLLYGWAPWHAYLFDVSRVQAGMIDMDEILFTRISTSPMTAMLAMRMPWSAALAVQLAASGCAVASVVLAVRRGADIRTLALIVATATFVVLPYAFAYDLQVVMIGALTLLGRADLSAGDRRLALYGFMAPQLGMVLAMFGIPLMPLMLLGLLTVQLRLAGRDADPLQSAKAASAVAM